MIKALNKSFKETCRILFGTDMGELLDFESWLQFHVPIPYPVKSAISGKEVWMPPPKVLLNIYFDRSRIISYDEMEQLRTPFTPLDLDGISLATIGKIVNPIARYVGNITVGNCINLEKTSCAGPGENVYYSEDACHNVKNIAYCNYVLTCEAMFGCYNTPNSSFCINVYNSSNLTRCFELDCCTNCRDSFFCHNCEGLSDCILCFNAKNLHYAIGNIEVGKEEYMRIKKILVDYIIMNLKSEKKLDVDIYNLACAHTSNKVIFQKQ